MPCVLLEDGKLYTCGEADGGKLGLPDQLDSCVRPRRVAAMKEKVCAVACGNSHTAVSTGNVYRGDRQTDRQTDRWSSL